MRTMLIGLVLLAASEAAAQSSYIVPDWSRPMIDLRKPVWTPPQSRVPRPAIGIDMDAWKTSRCVAIYVSGDGLGYKICD